MVYGKRALFLEHKKCNPCDKNSMRLCCRTIVALFNLDSTTCAEGSSGGNMVVWIGREQAGRWEAGHEDTSAY